MREFLKGIIQPRAYPGKNFPIPVIDLAGTKVKPLTYTLIPEHFGNIPAYDVFGYYMSPQADVLRKGEAVLINKQLTEQRLEAFGVNA